MLSCAPAESIAFPSMSFVLTVPMVVLGSLVESSYDVHMCCMFDLSMLLFFLSILLDYFCAE